MSFGDGATAAAFGRKPPGDGRAIHGRPLVASSGTVENVEREHDGLPGMNSAKLQRVFGERQTLASSKRPSQEGRRAAPL